MEQEITRPMRYIIADTETCGVGANKVACEIALMEINPVTLDVLQCWESLIDPEREIPQVVIDIHGITNEMVVDAPTMQEFLDVVLKDEFTDDDITLICHNVPFDLSLCLGIGAITQTVCTLFHARQLIHDSANHKLATLREHFDFPENEAHRALADCHTTRRLLKEILSRSDRSLADFAASNDQVVHTMPWGRHKGTLVLQVPASYLEWLWQLVDLEPNLRESVKKSLKVLGIKEINGVNK